VTASVPNPAFGPGLLVVDDEPLIRDVLRDLFVGDGFSVHTAADIGETEAILSQETISVALVDLKLAQSNGIQMLDRIRQIDPAVRVILMTGYPTIESVVEAIQHGAFNYIIKPFRLHNLQGAVRQALGECDKDRRSGLLNRRVRLLEQILKDHDIAVPDWSGETAKLKVLTPRMSEYHKN
jgi:DNA-binding NtrC family response regulator